MLALYKRRHGSQAFEKRRMPKTDCGRYILLFENGMREPRGINVSRRTSIKANAWC